MIGSWLSLVVFRLKVRKLDEKGLADEATEVDRLRNQIRESDRFDLVEKARLIDAQNARMKAISSAWDALLTRRFRK